MIRHADFRRLVKFPEAHQPATNMTMTPTLLKGISMNLLQAAIGSTALDTARELTPQNTTNEGLGIQLLTIAVLIILITAPLGSALISLTARHLLRKGTREDSDRDSAIEMNNIAECAREEDIELQARPADDPEGKNDNNMSV
ncbi:sodium/hydrogen exchanger 9B2-like [Branchiostoma floridae]|uniref:Sodium/hydrogen exchanger 9B2-like n=1 Tax=Branchiostoma floridae TaxID=7739 RepID=A0A9J7KUF9_BRAFL|nr:sodium/hydrogen exchanger 9B2-like [Branchiostoma floridae]